jgi:hypothetical protein
MSLWCYRVTIYMSVTIPFHYIKVSKIQNTGFKYVDATQRKAGQLKVQSKYHRLSMMNFGHIETSYGYKRIHSSCGEAPYQTNAMVTILPSQTPNINPFAMQNAPPTTTLAALRPKEGAPPSI